MVKIIKNKKISVLLSASLSFFIIISLLPSVMGATENEYPYFHMLSNFEVEDGDLSDLTTINQEPFWLKRSGGSYSHVYFYFDRPTLNYVTSELKVVYDYFDVYPAESLELTVHYYGEPWPDYFTLYPGPGAPRPQYQTAT